jgi:hypothetical protein
MRDPLDPTSGTLPRLGIAAALILAIWVLAFWAMAQ